MMEKGKSKDSKEDSLPKDTHKSMASTMMKPSLLLLDIPPSAHYLPLQSKWECKSTKWMLSQHS